MFFYSRPLKIDAYFGGKYNLMSSITKFIQRNRNLLGFGFTLTFLSSFGQTFVVSLYLPFIQETFDLSDGGFSSIYAIATLGSAFTITWAGRYIDRWRLPRFTLVVMLGLVVAVVLLSQAYYIPVLLVALYGLRLFGQGLLSHTSASSMARFFERSRGKALSLSALGHSVGEAVLPVVVVSAITWLGWRYALLSTAGLVLLAIPFVFWLLYRNANYSQRKLYLPLPFSAEEERDSRPWQIMRTPAFWVIVPSSFVAASIGTGFLLFKLKLGLAKDWSPTFVAVGFMAYAFGNAFSNIAAGFLADRFSGRQLFPIYLLPACIGFIALMSSDAHWVYIVLIGSIGLTNGFGGTIKNVILAEVYGTKIIGSVRSLFTMIMVFSTAVGPPLFGFLLDAGYSFGTLGGISLALYLLCTLNGWRSLSLRPKLGS